LGDVLRAQQRWGEALGSYQEALALDDRLALAHIGLGWVYCESMGDDQAAEAEFSRAIELAPGQGDGYAAMGELHSREGRYAEAETSYLQALERSLNNRWWQLARADAVRATGDLTRAVELYEAVVAQFPGFGEAHFELAMTYDSLGESTLAARSMDEATAKMTAPAASHFDQAGRVYAAAGEWARAARAFEYALGLDPSDSVAAEGHAQAQAMLAQATPPP
jgi:tetratricopeptide (TPR) repeat protein